MAVAYHIDERLEWRSWVIPKPLQEKPVHRWYIFPHSFTDDLVAGLVREWGLGCRDVILDPFVGAGTTVVSAKEMGVSAVGYDLSPLAVLATKVKIAEYDVKGLRDRWQALRACILTSLTNSGLKGPSRPYPDLVHRALPGDLLAFFDTILVQIGSLDADETYRDFFRLATLSLIPRYSRARATGGWLKWVDETEEARAIPVALERQIEMMLNDVEVMRNQHRDGLRTTYRVEEADARCLPDTGKSYSAVITSPPYPNRHDYTRVFGVELMLAFLDWEGTRRLRYQSFHSHPEARPLRPMAVEYSTPERLSFLLDRMRRGRSDPRILAMLEGYFRDMFLCLREVERVCKPGARIGFVVGNAQYYGEPIPVDELTAEVGERAGLLCERILVVRYRGNSAQQMGKYGRNPSRESIVVFRLPA